MKRLAIIGECMIELNGAPFGAMEQAYGGDSLNTAVYLARTTQGSLAVDYVTAMGRDALSQGMVERWRQEGVGTGLVLTDAQRQPGLYLIQLDDQGERTFLYWRNQSAARYLLQHPEFDGVASRLAGYDMVYLSGISLAILPPEDREVLFGLLAQLKRQGVQIAFDSNYRPALWADADEARGAYQRMLALTDLALVTLDDEQVLWGDAGPAQALTRLHRAGCREVVVKLGADGALYSAGADSTPLAVATTPVEQVVDTTSAGDSFNAGFLAGYLQEQSPEQCCRQGNALAGLVIRHKGAIIPAAATAGLNFTPTGQ
ncbi:sugar kinase [Oceanimonas marisflavi]|uniref:sugar kinase n=1 Tax=Oceanimonas marisflavi TaxID=2059724 RepID=UPI000D302D0A|nr:sugar kinase [Oceanimonas marisflavi]